MRCLRLWKSACGSGMELERQAVLAVLLHQGALPAGFGDGQLGGAFGTLGLLHDLLAKLVIASLLAESGQSLGHVLRFHLFALRRQTAVGCASSLNPIEMQAGLGPDCI